MPIERSYGAEEKQEGKNNANLSIHLVVKSQFSVSREAVGTQEYFLELVALRTDGADSPLLPFVRRRCGCEQKISEQAATSCVGRGYRCLGFRKNAGNDGGGKDERRRVRLWGPQKLTPAPLLRSRFNI